MDVLVRALVCWHLGQAQLNQVVDPGCAAHGAGLGGVDLFEHDGINEDLLASDGLEGLAHGVSAWCGTNLYPNRTHGADRYDRGYAAAL